MPKVAKKSDRQRREEARIQQQILRRRTASDHTESLPNNPETVALKDSAHGTFRFEAYFKYQEEKQQGHSEDRQQGCSSSMPKPVSSVDKGSSAKETRAEQQKKYRNRPEVKAAISARERAYRSQPQVKAAKREREQIQRSRPEVKAKRAERENSEK